MDYRQSYRNYVEVDLSALSHNARRARSLFPMQKLMAVVKGDAYGHGIAGCLQALEPYVDCYAVATLEEGATLRSKGTSKAILLLGPVPECQFLAAARLGLSLTIGSAAYAERYASALLEAGVRASVQIKLDTGLNRSGIIWREGEEARAMQELRQIHAHDALDVVGTYTHLACPESQDEDDIRYTAWQLRNFDAACAALEAEGLPLGTRHCCSTSSALLHEHMRMDMLRLGMLLYGQCFSQQAIAQYGLRPALRWVSFLREIRTVKAGESIGYGRAYRAEWDMRVALVTAGYADGYRRCYAPGARCIVRGCYAPVIGRVCMDYLMLDVTDVPLACEGDEITLLGEQDGLFISANALSELACSVSGEVTAAIASRVPRIYINGRISN